MLQKTNVPGYLKDEKSKVVVNVNDNELKQYQYIRNKILKQNDLNIKIADMESDIDDIKILLLKLVKNQEGK